MFRLSILFLVLFKLTSLHAQHKDSNKLIDLNLDLSNAFLKAQDQWKIDHPNDPQVFAYCVYRSNATQAKYYAQGRTKKGPIITNVKRNGMHNRYPSRAIDVIFRKNNKEIWNQKWYDLFSLYMKRYEKRVVYGGSWRTINDYPHFEIK
jgi:hypothetical protein